MTILITGASGQLGMELQEFLKNKKINFLATDSKELDITNKKQVSDFFEKYQPNIVYHCAAYTAVDKAENDGKDVNQLVNVIGTKNIAEACSKIDALLVYISTDYVFDGKNQGIEYAVDAITNPLNEYGRSKLAGEEEVRKYATKYYIIRTSWVYGQYGNNFVFTMKKLAETHSQLTVVSDQFGRPTWTRDLASFMTYAVEKSIPFGTYHFSNQNSCSWFEFASEILKNNQIEVIAVTSSEYPQKAVRPQYSIMDLSKVEKTGFDIPSWQESLARFLESISSS